jgi:hypothetical protein
MAYTFDEPKLGLLQIANVDAGVTSPAGVSSGVTTTIPTPPNVLGMIVKATDPTYGQGEFILLPGASSQTVGLVYTYSPTTFAVTACPNTANLSQPVAVAMAANTSTTQFSWYQISGLAVVKKTAVKVDPAGTRRMYQSGTAGRWMQTSAAGKNVLGCASANTATVTSTTSTVVCSINRPHMQGPIT